MTTQTKQTHTPGPFSISGIPGDNHIMARVGERKETVAILTGWQGIDPKEFEANKALFAAAPDLLNACECVRMMSGAFQDITPECWQKLNAAIWKARGYK